MIFGIRIATQMPQHSNYLNSSLNSPRYIPLLSWGRAIFAGVVCSIVSIIYFVADGGHLNCDAACVFVSANC